MKRQRRIPRSDAVQEAFRIDITVVCKYTMYIGKGLIQVSHYKSSFGRAVISLLA